MQQLLLIILITILILVILRLKVTVPIIHPLIPTILIREEPSPTVIRRMLGLVNNMVMVRTTMMVVGAMMMIVEASIVTTREDLITLFMIVHITMVMEKLLISKVITMTIAVIAPIPTAVADVFIIGVKNLTIIAIIIYTDMLVRNFKCIMNFIP